MLSQPFTLLQALPDLSVFQFRTGYGDTILIRLQFALLRSGIYDLNIEQQLPANRSYPWLITDEEAKGLIYTVVQVIELYTERYPGRVVRLQGATEFQQTLFRIILRARYDLLLPLFSIDKEGRSWFFPFRRSAGDSVFLLKRRADSPLPSHPVRSSVNTRSRLFGNLVHVELRREMTIGQLDFAAL